MQMPGKILSYSHYCQYGNGIKVQSKYLESNVEKRSIAKIPQKKDAERPE
jgi:hypothetical protein